jgi:RNA polymerase sigma-70 factor (ECF subfamily)
LPPQSVNPDELRWRRDPDVRLMLQVRDDRPGAFDQLVSKYQDRVVGILHHLIGDLQEAEDLAQTAFLRIYRNRKEYLPRAKFSTWLFTIVNNLAMNAKRDRRRRPTSASTSSVGATSTGMQPIDRMLAAPSGATPSRLLAKVELSELVREAVAQLSDEQRLAVILNKFEDMSYRDIAGVLGKSEMAVKSLLSRARAALKEVLEPYLQNGERAGVRDHNKG